MPTPEDQARQTIDTLLAQAGWVVQDYKDANLNAAQGVILRNFPLANSHGFADYLLYLNGKAAGVIEAKREGFPLVGVEVQATRYSQGLPANLPAHNRPLPFLYQSTGIETRFTNRFDPAPRRIFCFHRPETLGSWLSDETFLKRLRQLPPSWMIFGLPNHKPSKILSSRYARTDLDRWSKWRRALARLS